MSSPVLASPATAWCAAAAASLLRLQGGLLRRGAGSGRGKGGVGMDHPHQDAHGRHAPLERQPAHCWSAAAAPPPAGPVEAVEGAEVEASAAVAEPKAGGAGGVVGSGGGVEVRDVHLQVGGHQVPLPLPLQLQAQGQAAGQTAGSSTTGSSSSGHGGVVGQVASALAALAGGGAAAAAAVEGLCAAGDSRAALTQLAPGWAVAPGVEKVGGGACGARARHWSTTTTTAPHALTTTSVHPRHELPLHLLHHHTTVFRSPIPLPHVPQDYTTLLRARRYLDGLAIVYSGIGMNYTSSPPPHTHVPSHRPPL